MALSPGPVVSRSRTWNARKTAPHRPLRLLLSHQMRAHDPRAPLLAWCAFPKSQEGLNVPRAAWPVAIRTRGSGGFRESGAQHGCRTLLNFGVCCELAVCRPRALKWAPSRFQSAENVALWKFSTALFKKNGAGLTKKMRLSPKRALARFIPSQSSPVANVISARVPASTHHLNFTATGPAGPPTSTPQRVQFAACFLGRGEWCLIMNSPYA